MDASAVVTTSPQASTSTAADTSAFFGLGASMARSLVQFYARMCMDTLGLLAIDALTSTFSETGVSAVDLTDYLRLTKQATAVLRGNDDSNNTPQSNPQLQSALDSLLPTLLCTSTSSTQTDILKQQPRTTLYHINYRKAIPYCVAYLSKLYMYKCFVTVPKEHPQHPDAHAGAASMTTGSAPAARRPQPSKDVQGIYCQKCNVFLFSVETLVKVVKCPSCGSNLLGSALQLAKSVVDARTNKDTNVYVPGKGKSARSATAIPDGERKERQQVEANDEFCAPQLLRDPFLLQQALFVDYVATTQLVCVSPNVEVTEAEAFMTLQEFQRRAEHGTSSSSLRYGRLSARHVRVKLASLAELEAQRATEAALKIEKRGFLPPWLQQSGGAATGAHSGALEEAHRLQRAAHAEAEQRAPLAKPLVEVLLRNWEAATVHDGALLLEESNDEFEVVTF